MKPGRRVPNPISFLSRWKILDNLRRSLVEAGIFLLFVLGWTVLPGKPLYWTLVTIAILFVPPWFQFAFSAVRTLASGQFRPLGDAVAGLGKAMVNVFLTLTFLAHQALISADAVFRTFYRRLVSRAAPAGVGDGRRSGDGKWKTDLRRRSSELDACRRVDRWCHRLFLAPTRAV